AQIGLGALHLRQISLMRAQVAAWSPTTWFAPLSNTRSLAFNRGRLGEQAAHSPLHTPHGLIPAVKQMPDIALVAALRIDLLTRRAHGMAAITDGGVPAQAAILRQPEQQDPTLGIDGEWRFGGPNCPTVGVDHIEVGTPAVGGIDLVQRQRARSG